MPPAPSSGLSRLALLGLLLGLVPGPAGAAAPAAAVVGLGYGEVPLPPYPGVLPGSRAYVYRDIRPEPLRLHVFPPAGWRAGDRRPTLIWFFGGAWSSGNPGFSVPFARWAAGVGMVGIAPDYRVRSRHGTLPGASVADARLVLRWVEEHAGELGIDPALIVVGGNSAGGHLALWTAIKASPPGSDPAEAPTLKPAALILTSTASDTSQAGASLFGNSDPLALSPVQHLDPAMPPEIEFHGRTDALVPFASAEALHERLLAAGNVSELVAIEGGGHNFVADVPAWKDRLLAEMRGFLERSHVLPKGSGMRPAEPNP